MSSTATSASMAQTQQPPMAALWGAVAALVVSAALLIPWGTTASVVGYLLAPLVVTGLVTLYTYKDIRASQSVWYSANPTRKKISTAIVIAGFAVGLVHSWVIATEIAKAFAS